MKTYLRHRLTLLATAIGGLVLCAGLPAAAQSSDVQIRSTPSGATVSIDGRTAGVTPLALPAFAPGKHLVTASLKGYRDLHKTLITEPDQQTVLDLALEPLCGLLLLHSTPAGAEVEVNDVHRGITPVLITDLPPGIHRARITKSGFLTRQIDISINSRTPERIQVALTADIATLSVKATPANAVVTLDGVTRGTAPCTIQDVRTGEISLVIAAPGHHPFAETLALQAGEVRELEIALRPQPSSLHIVTTPAGARILLNDKFRGRAPVRLTNLKAGEYSLRAELDAHDPATRTVRVELGRDHVEELTLTPNAGRLEIITEPAGVRVLLNGVPVGETEPAPDKTDKLSSIFTLPLVPVGTNELTLTKAGFYPLTETITIVRNETRTSHYGLQRRFIPNCQVQTTTETYRGLLIERNEDSLKLELSPGVFKTFQRLDITSVTPLRTPEPVAETPPSPVPGNPPAPVPEKP